MKSGTGSNKEVTMTAEQMIEQERREHAEYEAKTVVTEQGETIETLRKVFDKVCDAKDWKAPWAAKVPHEIVGVVCRAVEFFHADRAEIVGIERLTGRVLMAGRGYMA